MNKNGPIVIIEDDQEDQEILSEIFKSPDYPNEIIFFTDGHKALDYLLASGEKMEACLFPLTGKISKNQRLGFTAFYI